MKLNLLAVTSLVLVAAIASPAMAQRRNCVVDERSGQVACGRAASSYEIDQYYGGGSGGGWNNNNSQYNERQAYDRVNQLYRDILGRDGDFNSLRSYAYQLQSGRSLSDVRSELARSNEAVEAIRRIYREVLGREADSAGLYGYQRNLESGWSLNQIRSEIANSQEARNRR
jgi:opacity protein-like surface antigen